MSASYPSDLLKGRSSVQTGNPALLHVHKWQSRGSHIIPCSGNSHAVYSCPEPHWWLLNSRLFSAFANSEFRHWHMQGTSNTAERVGVWERTCAGGGLFPVATCGSLTAPHRRKKLRGDERSRVACLGSAFLEGQRLDKTI
jgi:hypothetical protein